MKEIAFDQESLYKGAPVLIVYEGFTIPESPSSSAEGPAPIIFHSNGYATFVGNLNIEATDDTNQRIMGTSIPEDYPWRNRDEEYLQNQLSNKIYSKENELNHSLSDLEKRELEDTIRSQGLPFEKEYKAENFVRGLISEDEVDAYLSVMHDNFRFTNMIHARNSFAAGFITQKNSLTLEPEPENYPRRQRFLGQTDQASTIYFGNRHFSFKDEEAPVLQKYISEAGINSSIDAWFYSRNLQEIVIGPEKINARLADSGNNKLPGGPYPRLVDSRLISDFLQ